MLAPPVRQPLSGVGERALHDLHGGEPARAASRGEDAPPADDTAFLLGGVEEHERRMGDADDRGQRGRVRVVDHDGACLRIEPLAQPRCIAGEREGAGGAGLDDATPVEKLPAGQAPQPAKADRRPLNQLPTTDADPSERDEDRDDREGHDDGPAVQAQDQRACRKARHHELRT